MLVGLGDRVFAVRTGGISVTEALPPDDNSGKLEGYEEPSPGGWEDYPLDELAIRDARPKMLSAELTAADLYWTRTFNATLFGMTRSKAGSLSPS
jgi:hypothetical protein